MSVAAERTIEIDGVRHYLARPAQPSGAGVLLLPHNVGVDHFVQTFADELAGRGYTTIAWNPYPSVPLGEAFTERPPRPNDEATMKALSRCLDVMASGYGVTAFATLGFCMGGRYVLLFGARERRLRAAVACYPSIPVQLSPGQDLEPIPAAAAIACPVQVAYPGRDIVTSRTTFEALQAQLQGRAAETSILYYPQAEHGFMHAPSPANDAATRTAKPQIFGFLESCMR
ncbi:MAG: dienelactone hydrolase family protein [Candidatus Lustribacter sp.]|jgi:carboxymethylenebutenolidase